MLSHAVVQLKAPSKIPRAVIVSGQRRSDNEALMCSVIVPVYNERDNVRAMYQALCEVAAGEPSLDWEFLFVEDGSTDDTFAILADLNCTDPRVKIVRLSRNYGSHTGAAAGLQFASGHAAVIMAGDLQDHPREIPRFLGKWREGFHVVWGVLASRQDGRLDRLLSDMFSALIRGVALPAYPRGTGSFCLLDRKVIDALNGFPERNRLTSGLILLAGFRQTEVQYDRLERHSGVSKWSLRRKIKLTVDTVVSFSSLPMRVTSATGVIIAVLSFIFAAYIALDTLIQGHAPEGWATIIVLVLLLGGLQLIFLGIMGEYLWRVCEETRRRPLFLVQELTGTFPRVERLSKAENCREVSIDHLTPSPS
jgi:glycosyltransferase involved in cell wall biosynthesis